MTPILFSADTTDFTTNGLGRLTDAIECTVRETLEGLFELDLVYPITGTHFADLQIGAIITATPSQKRGPQPFRIYRITRPISGRVVVFCRHISYQMSFIPVSAFSAIGLEATLAALKSHAAVTCPFDFETEMESEATFTLADPASMRSVMGGKGITILSVFGGAWEWDGWTARLVQERGTETSVRIAYGKNLAELEQDEDLEKTYTAIYPYWTSGSNRVELPEKVVRCEYADLYPFDRVKIEDCSDYFQGAPTAQELRDYATALMAEQNFGLPAVNLTVNFVAIGDTLVDLGDIVTVDFVRLGVHKQEQIISITWDALKERYSEIEIGDPRSTLASVIEDQIETIETMPTSEAVQNRVDHATGILAAGRGGHVVMNRNSDGWVDEVLIMDNADYSLARQVLRINQNGIGFSSSGYQGPYYQAWTLDGILSLGGVNNAYGVLQLRNASGDIIGSFSAANGLEFDRGQDIGFKADGTNVRIGDFYVGDEYGRQILQSSDERTGMSGEPNHSAGYYFWANWQNEGGEETFGLIVDGEGAKVQWIDQDDDRITYNIGEELEYLKRKCKSLQDQIDELGPTTP